MKFSKTLEKTYPNCGSSQCIGATKKGEGQCNNWARIEMSGKDKKRSSPETLPPRRWRV